MGQNLSKYKADLEKLRDQGIRLLLAMQRNCHKEEFDKLYKKSLKDKYDAFVKTIPNFEKKYQAWYSEALALVNQILPERVGYFISLYEVPKGRKELNFTSYVIADYLLGVRTTYLGEEKAGPRAAIPKFEQQLAVVDAATARFESSLFEIRSIVQADLFDSELASAGELLKHKFFRAAGAVAGVILEKHLQEVCKNHKIVVPKKNGIAVLNELLKNADVIEISQWRFITLMGDLRNKCDHNRELEPTKDDIQQLLDGVNKLMKTVF